MIEPHISEKLVFPRAWQLTSVALALIVTLGLIVSAVAQSAA